MPRPVVLAGFMRILTPLRGALRRPHAEYPSLAAAQLPACIPTAALEAGVKLHGASVHFVTPRLDHGPIVVQAAIDVLPGDTPESLAARLLDCEHRIYPRAVRWFVQDRLRVEDGRVEVEPRVATAGPTASRGGAAMNRRDNNHNGGARRSRDGRDERQPSRGRGAGRRCASPPAPREAGAGAGETRAGHGLHPSHVQHIDRLLGKVMLFARPADAVVSHYFRENPKLGHRERGIIAEAVFAVLRRRVEFAQFARAARAPRHAGWPCLARRRPGAVTP